MVGYNELPGNGVETTLTDESLMESFDVDNEGKSPPQTSSGAALRRSSEHEEDDRLEAMNGGNGPLHEGREGNSSQDQHQVALNDFNDEVGQDIDLELQRPNSRLTTKERILNVFHHFVPIKQTYDRINNGLTTGRMQPNVPGRFIGQGTDGVFRNLMAKPETESNRVEQEGNPPSYEEAAADATPEYWESTVISPMYEDEVFVEGLPVGNIANFIWNGLVTVAFQFVGFVLCYLLHTSHAAKQGSRAGLGITFMLYGYGMTPSNTGQSDRLPDKYEPNNPNSYDIDKWLLIKGSKVDTYNSGMFQQHSEITHQDHKAPYFAYGLIAFGLFIVLKSFLDYYKVKQMEKIILAPSSSTLNTSAATSSANENTTESEEE